MGKNNEQENPMNTITRRWPTANHAARVVNQVEALAAKVAKKGIETDLTATITPEYDEDRKWTYYVVTVTFSDLVRFAGGWRLLAVADATATDEPMIFSLDDNASIDGVIDMSRCDHCGRRVQRNKVLFIQNDAGEQMQVGGSCAKDFLGHDPFWTSLLFDAVENPADPKGRIDYPVEIYLAAAIEANRIGYRKVDDDLPTVKIIRAMLCGDLYELKKWEDVRYAIENAPAATVNVQQVLDWMREQDGEFGANLRRIADSKSITEKAFGIAAYAPTGADKHRVAKAEQAARQAAEEARRANASDCPTGKVTIEGEVTRLSWKSSEYGDTLKMRVVSTEGYTVYGTVPRILEDDLEVGDRVRFSATVTPSSDDSTFGFYKRPTKSEIIERAQVSC